MSLYIQFKSTFGINKFFRIRAPYAAIGMTSRGILTDQPHSDTVLSIVRKVDGYSIYFQESGDSLHLFFGQNQKKELKNFSVMFIATHQGSEFLNLEKIDLHQPTSSFGAWAEVLLLNAHIKANISQGAPFTIGSDHACSLYLPFEGINKIHAHMLLKNKTLTVEGASSNLSIEGGCLIMNPLALPVTITGVDEILLTPLDKTM